MPNTFIADAIFGALGLPDIGHYFPDNAPENKDLDSLNILQKAVEESAKQGYKLGNIDLTLILEEPKIGPYTNQIKEKISACCGLKVERIGIKATTNEGLGAIGRKEGVAAFAVCTLVKRNLTNDLIGIKKAIYFCEGRFRAIRGMYNVSHSICS